MGATLHVTTRTRTRTSKAVEAHAASMRLGIVLARVGMTWVPRKVQLRVPPWRAETAVRMTHLVEANRRQTSFPCPSVLSLSALHVVRQRQSAHVLQAVLLPDLTQTPFQLVQTRVTTTTTAEHQMKTARHILPVTATYLLYFVKRVGCWKCAACALTQTVLDLATSIKKKSPFLHARVPL